MAQENDLPYSSPPRKLLRFFLKSRDQWKAKCQRAKATVKRLENRVRFLEKSKDEWKTRARALENSLQVRTSTTQRKHHQSSNSAKKNKPRLRRHDPKAYLPPENHHYPTYIIQLSIQLCIEARNSHRGAQKTLELFSQFFNIEVPSSGSIRKWIYRLGLYLLKQKVEFRSDWIFILDHTLELGDVKCLVILGIPTTRLKKTGFSLKHKDVDVLDIDFLLHSTGDIIYQKLRSLSERVGTPVQILSDYGPDLKKGIELFQQDYPIVVFTYDVTHKMATLLKKHTEKDERWNSFLNHCTSTIRQNQQTELSFLVPPKLRTKSRYLNVDTHVKWAQRMLLYQKRGDFLQIIPTFNLDKEAMRALKPQLNQKILSCLSLLESRLFFNNNSSDSFRRRFSHIL